MAEPLLPENWRLDHCFTDIEDNRISCGRTDCTLGIYVVAVSYLTVGYAPACITCSFSADLSDVFNPNEPRYEPGAPEDFKRGAALALKHKLYSPLERVIRLVRPDTAAMIDDYASREA